MSSLPRPPSSLQQPLRDLVLERVAPVLQQHTEPERRSDLSPGDDRAAILAWLREYARRPNTLRAYQREARRFHLWLSTVRHTSLVQLTRQDLADYDAFLAAPPASWLPETAQDGDKNSAQANGRAWRPLRAPLNPYGRRQALIILQVMLQYLCDEGYLLRNPARLIRDKGRAPPRKQRAVPDARTMAHALASLVAEAEQLDADGTATAEACALARRDALVWAWIYWTGARRHELAHAIRSAITRRVEGDAVQWWWTVHGKGELQAFIPVATQAIDTLAWYLGCSVDQLIEQLTAEASEPLVERVRRAAESEACVKPSEIYESVRRGAGVIAKVVGAGTGTPQDIDAFARARPHDLRAFRATHLLNAKVDPRNVQRLMRHADINTTLLYDHTQETLFHDSVAL